MKSSHNHYLTITVILLLLSVISVRGCPSDYDPDKTRRTLVTLFEEGLVHNGDNLDALRQVYFNPSHKYSPASVYLNVKVTVNNITCLNSPWPYDDCDKAFESFGPEWSFDSMYILQLSNDESGSSQLSRLLSTLLITSVFEAFDPTFFTIMKALSSSFTPFFNPLDQDDLCMECTRDIYIHLSEDLEDMPCRNQAVDALKLVLMWVSCTNSMGGGPGQLAQVQSKQLLSQICGLVFNGHYMIIPLIIPLTGKSLCQSKWQFTMSSTRNGQKFSLRVTTN